jgi:hypothetical protein
MAPGYTLSPEAALTSEIYAMSRRRVIRCTQPQLLIAAPVVVAHAHKRLSKRLVLCMAVSLRYSQLKLTLPLMVAQVGMHDRGTWGMSSLSAVVEV